MTSRAKRATNAKSAPAKKSRFSFFAEVVAELRKAHWPSRQEALRLSVLVFIVCATVGGILGALDYGFFRLFSDLLLGG
ncbi:MAG: preprotein translocase subunit SecE [Dehalococcoidia bacterium]